MKSINDFLVIKTAPYVFNKKQVSDNLTFPILTTSCIKLANNEYIIVLGFDTNEKNIIGSINHEYLHCILRYIDEPEASEKLDLLWHSYEFETSILYKKILENLSYSGIGYSSHASFIDHIHALIVKIKLLLHLLE